MATADRVSQAAWDEWENYARENAMNSAVEPHVTPGNEPAPRPTGDAQLVVVRPHVVENIGHVLGNFFQRIYHLIDRARAADAATADQLHASTRRLEDFLQLVIDYLSPLSLSLQVVPGTEVAQSLARQVSDATGGAVKVDAKLPTESRLLVDPGRLARGFALLALMLEAVPEGDEPIQLHAVARPVSRSLALTVTIPHRYVPPHTSESEMRWALAEKFFEIQGGTLQEHAVPSGEVSWEIVLPLQS